MSERERNIRRQVAEELDVSPDEVTVEREGSRLVAELSEEARESLTAEELGADKP